MVLPVTETCPCFTRLCSDTLSQQPPERIQFYPEQTQDASYFGCGRQRTLPLTYAWFDTFYDKEEDRG